VTESASNHSNDDNPRVFALFSTHNSMHALDVLKSTKFGEQFGQRLILLNLPKMVRTRIIPRATIPG